MLRDISIQARKAGQSPGTLSATGRKTFPTQLTVMHYSQTNCHQSTDPADALLPLEKDRVRWVHVEGFQDVGRLTALQQHYHLHPLTMEDVLSNAQRPKTEEFENYIFVTLKMLSFKKSSRHFKTSQIALILGENFVLSFSSLPVQAFASIRERLCSNPNQRLREQKADYLFYRLIDTLIDQYFVVLESVGEKIDAMESAIIAKPVQAHTRALYRLKRKALLLRKAIWPMREAVSHLTQLDEKFIGRFTRTYLRDVYDHVMQAIDTIETYRDMLSSMLDVFLSSMTNRLNEVMKTLTVISTIFIPITFIASFYGMNFSGMPELTWKYGYTASLLLMISSTVAMIYYFKKKKWF